MIKRRVLMSTLRKCTQYRKEGLWTTMFLAYRVLLEKRKENAPFWEKKVLTVEEAAEYTGIGRTKIRQIIMRGDCPLLSLTVFRSV